MIEVANSQQELLQHWADEYLLEYAKDTATTRELAVWAITTGRWSPPADLAVQRCRQEFSKALREHYFTDEFGRSVRAKHVIREQQGDKQLFLWADVRTASPKHMATAFQQRREQIVGECRQLKSDVDYFNKSHPGEREIQLLLDFRDDIEEGEFPKEYPPKMPR